MEEKIFEFLKKYKITNSHGAFIVGFSGGQDSLCLIDILNKLSKKYGFKIIATHLNHNWRGENSAKEQEFCREFCAKRKVEFYTKTLDILEKKTEKTAREERYKFFGEIVKKTCAKGVFTAHTKTDNTETILYRIIKGTGILGLCAIPEIRQEKAYKLFRPMLDITREETKKYCAENNLKPAQDESNEDTKYARNKIRLAIIPKIKEINPNFDHSAENLSKIAKDYEEIIAEIFKQKPLTPCNFAEFSDAEKRVAIHKFLTENKLDYDFKKVEEIKEFLDKNTKKPCGNTLSLTTNKWLFASKEEIKIITEIKSPKINEILELKLNSDNYFAPLNKILEIKKFEGENIEKFPKETASKAFADIPENLLPLELRTRQEGDIIQPFGSCGTMKLKKYFINKGVPEHKRDEIPLLARGNEILWVIGVGLSEKLRASGKPAYIMELR